MDARTRQLPDGGTRLSVQPVVVDYLSQIFTKHYKLEPGNAAEEALRFLEIIELYGMELIIGEWTVPEVVVVGKPGAKDAWSVALDAMKQAEEREPWLAKEIQ